MDDTFIVLMHKNLNTGLFEKEVCTLKISKYESLIINAFVFNNSNGELFVNIKLSTNTDVSDWEYTAIYDYYDTSVFENHVISINDFDNFYNPTWELIFNYIDNIDDLEKKITQLLDLHYNELEEVLNIIAENKNDYI